MILKHKFDIGDKVFIETWGLEGVVFSKIFPKKYMICVGGEYFTIKESFLREVKDARETS